MNNKRLLYAHAKRLTIIWPLSSNSTTIHLTAYDNDITVTSVNIERASDTGLPWRNQPSNILACVFSLSSRDDLLVASEHLDVRGVIALNNILTIFHYGNSVNIWWVLHNNTTYYLFHVQQTAHVNIYPETWHLCFNTPNRKTQFLPILSYLASLKNSWIACSE